EGGGQRRDEEWHGQQHEGQSVPHPSPRRTVSPPAGGRPVLVRRRWVSLPGRGCPVALPGRD
ncbi:hypothetical protein, partial [Streptomyces sp. ZEA17I]|uniref:hypothetical protein n=1 Tax=Streptomyces sp. ZEA17I TaxID=2202516 RepID=UPI001C641F59